MGFSGGADHYKWVWIGIGYLVFCIALFNVAIVWAHKALGGMGYFTWVIPSMLSAICVSFHCTCLLDVHTTRY